jgi:nitrogen fixation NifU-like protein
MPNLSELYQNVILEHNRSPRNYRAMVDADGKADGHNPLCGDTSPSGCAWTAM